MLFGWSTTDPLLMTRSRFKELWTTGYVEVTLISPSIPFLNSAYRESVALP